jgi:hypothetical protein
MPFTTWKIMARRTGQAGYHYLATLQKGRAPSVGEQIEFVADDCMVRCAVTEVFKERSARAGVDNFTVRVDEIEAATDSGSKTADDIP